MTKYWKRVQSLLAKQGLYYSKLLKRPTKVAALFLVASLILSQSCRRPEDDIGIDLQPEDDLFRVGVVDTFTVVARTLFEDTLRTDKLNPGTVGAYMDPSFGLFKAGHVSELRLDPNSGSPVFISSESTFEDIVIDSLILVLNYAVQAQTVAGGRNFLGDDGAQYFQVFEITDSLSTDSLYYSGRVPNIVGEDLVKSGANLKPLTTRFDSVRVGDATVPGQLRIPLREEFAERFFQQGPGQSLNVEDFVTLLKGLYITVDETSMNLYDSGVLYMETFDQVFGSRMVMYFRDTNTMDTLEYAFPIRGNSGKYNTFEHDFFFSEQELFNQLYGDGSSSDQSLYLQAGAGTKIWVEFPTIKNLQDSIDLAINKAELILPVRDENLKDFPPPNLLFAFGLRPDSSIFFIQDQIDQILDGSYDPITKSYRLIITRFLQQAILEEHEAIGLEIVVNRAGFSANRVILNGPDYPDPQDPANNLKLVVTFTNF